MDHLLQDVRYAIRVLVKDRGFTFTSVLTLAVCIGANTAIFALVNSVLLQPLPFADASQLVLMYNAYPGAGVGDRGSTAVPDYYDRLRETTVFTDQALLDVRGVTLGQEGSPQRVSSMMATPSLLPLLRVQPALGRVFTPDDGEPGNERKVILTHEAWQQFFGGRADAVGQDLRVDGELHAVVGVLPEGFRFLDPEVMVWMPAAFDAEDRSDDSRHSNNWTYVGRLEAGATIEQARQEVDALNTRNLDRFPSLKQALINVGFHTVVLPFQDYLVRDLRGTLYLLWGGVTFVLLIGAVNVTNLMLVKSSTRTKELATRHALGAGMLRVAGQLLTESLLLTCVGGAAGLALGWASVRGIIAAGLGDTPQGTTVTMDTQVVMFTLGLAALLGVLIALIPVLGLRTGLLSQAFREEGRSGTASRGARRVRRALVASQVAFAFMLLTGAGLLLASFQRVLAIEPGFEPDGVLTGSITLPAVRYPEDTDLNAFAGRLLERVRALPGVAAAGFTTSIPMGNNFSDSVILAEGYVMAPGESLISPSNISASPGYFETMQIPLKQGRLFRDADVMDAQRVVIIDERLAAKFFAGTDPIGRRLWQPGSPEDLARGMGPESDIYTIVGVVGSVRMRELTQEGTVGAYYFPVAQREDLRTLTLAMRTTGNLDALTTAAGREIAALDPQLPFYAVRSMQQRIDESLLNRRAPMLVGTLFAHIALFLACVGIYGVLAYQVAQRRREMGIRLALGSEPRQVFRLVLNEGVLLLAAGLIAGFAGAVALRNLLETQLFETRALDPGVLALVTGVLAAVAIVACGVPARRAAKINPLTALTDR